MAIFAGDLPGALLRIPGTPASAAYTDDAHRMVQKGQGGLALGLGLVASAIGGVVGAVILHRRRPVARPDRAPVLELREILARLPRPDGGGRGQPRPLDQGGAQPAHRPRHRPGRPGSGLRPRPLHPRLGPPDRRARLHPGADRRLRRSASAALRPRRAGDGEAGAPGSHEHPDRRRPRVAPAPLGHRPWLDHRCRHRRHSGRRRRHRGLRLLRHQPPALQPRRRIRHGHPRWHRHRVGRQQRLDRRCPGARPRCSASRATA